MTVNKLRDFIFKNYYKRIQFVKESSYYSMKPLKKKKKGLVLLSTNLIKNITDPSNAKEYYNSYWKRNKYKIG